MTLPSDVRQSLSKPDIPVWSPRFTDLLDERRKVFLVIIDGVSKTVFDQADIPTIRSLQNQGLYYEHCVTTTPTITGSAHTSIHTGTYPSVHGVGLPWSFCQDRGIYPADGSNFSSFIADSLRSNGMSSAAISDGMAKNSFVQVYGEGFFGHSISEVAQEWRHIHKRYQPKLTTVTFYATDTLGHRFGAGHELVFGALAEIDKEIQHFIDDLTETSEMDDILWVFTSDHGMASSVTSINDWVDERISSGYWMAPNMRSILVEDRLIDSDNIMNLPFVDKVFSGEFLRELGLHVPEARSLVTMKHGFGYHGEKPEVANHGGLTEDERRVPLVISGRGVTAGTSSTSVETVDIAPTIAEALGGTYLETFRGQPLTEAFGVSMTSEQQARAKQRQLMYDVVHGGVRRVGGDSLLGLRLGQHDVHQNGQERIK